MGYGHQRKPGSGVAYDPMPGAGGNGVPGKRTLTDGLAAPPNGRYGNSLFSQGLVSPTVQHRIGNSLVDEGLGCMTAAMGLQECLLTPEQRAMLLPTYQSRVNAALTQYVAAVQQLRVEELLKKEPEPTEWMFELLLEVIGSVALGTAMKVFHAMKGGATAIEGVVEDGQKVAAAAASESDGRISSALGIAVGMGKKKMTSGLAKGTDPSKPQEGTKKAANIAFLDHLADRAAFIYEAFREDLIAGASDTMLLVFFEAFRASNGHTLSTYKEALTGKLKRFEKSGVGKLGVAANEEFDATAQLVGAEGLEKYQKLETKAFWVKTPMGNKLGLYVRGHNPAAVPSEVPALVGYRDTTPIEKVAYAQRDLAARPFQFVGYVAPEFVQAAVSMHASRWGMTPTETAAGIHEIMQMGSV